MLTEEQLEQLKSVGEGDIRDGVQKLASSYRTLMYVLGRNVAAAEGVLATAQRYFDASQIDQVEHLAEFEAQVEVAKRKYQEAMSRYAIVPHLEELIHSSTGR